MSLEPVANQAARRAVGEDAGIHHDELCGRARLAAVHQPAVADLGIDGEHDLRQLCLTDAPVEDDPQPIDLRVLRLGGERRQVQRRVNGQAIVGRGFCDHRYTGGGALEQGFEERRAPGRQGEPPVVRPRAFPPTASQG